MDAATIAGQLALALVPLLPYLTGIGQHDMQAAAQRAGQQLGDDAFADLTDLWDRLWPELRRRRTRSTVQRVAQQPDPRQRADLAAALELVLRAEPDLQTAASDLLRRHPNLTDPER
jgi:hypothetical protein